MHIRHTILTALLVLTTACSAATSPESSSTPASPSETAATSEETAAALTADEAIQTVDAYFAAYDAGNVEGMIDLLTPDARLVLLGEMTAEEWRLLYEWEHAQGTEMLPHDCEAEQADQTDRVLVICEYGQHQYLSRVVDGPAVPFTGRFVVTGAGIDQLTESFGSPDFNTYNQPFYAWMEAHHPDDADAVGCCGGESVEDARRKGELRIEYADLWAAWLEDHPTCTWRDTDCQSDGA